MRRVYIAAGWLFIVGGVALFVDGMIETALSTDHSMSAFILVGILSCLTVGLGFAFRILAGVGLAGTYMPGLRVLTDRLDDASRPRAIAFYTASFGIGTSLSYAASAMLAEQFGWQVAFVAAACGAALAFALVALAVGGVVQRRRP